MRPTTTYEEYIAANPDFVTDMEAAGATSAIQEIIGDEFFNRTICDETYFGRYFLKALKRYIPVYTDYVRIEAAKHDFTPMVTRYLLEAINGSDTPVEYTKTITPASTRQTKTPAGHTVTDTPAETTKTYTPAHTKDTITPAEVTREITPAETTEKTTYNSATERNGSSTVTDNGTTIDTRQTEQDRKRVSKTLPMSSSNVAAASGNISIGGTSPDEITGLDWSDASAQDQQTDGGYEKTEHDYNGSSHETVYSGLKDERTGDDTTAFTTQTAGKEIDTTQTAGTEEHETLEAGSDAYTTQTAGTRQTVYNNDEVIDKSITAGGTESMSISKAGSKEDNRVYVGAEGLTPQAAMRQALDFLREIATSEEMLIEKLEPCFLSVIDI